MDFHTALQICFIMKKYILFCKIMLKSSEKLYVISSAGINE